MPKPLGRVGGGLAECCSLPYGAGVLCWGPFHRKAEAGGPAINTLRAATVGAAGWESGLL